MPRCADGTSGGLRAGFGWPAPLALHAVCGFATSSSLACAAADRPNPIGLHRVTVLQVQGTRLLVSDREALDGTPVLDIKPVLGALDER